MRVFKENGLWTCSDVFFLFNLFSFFFFLDQFSVHKEGKTTPILTSVTLLYIDEASSS